MVITIRFMRCVIYLMCISRHVATGTILGDIFRRITDSFIPDFNIYDSSFGITKAACIRSCQIDNGCTSIRYLASNETCKFSNAAMVVSPASLQPNSLNWDVYMRGPYRYELVKEPKNWDEGKLFCEAKGGHLAVISKPAENQAIATGLIANGHHWDSTSSFGPWLGANDLDIPNMYKWVDGTALTGEYENWMADNPDGDLADENCVHMGGPPNVPDYRWNDYGCSIVLWLICEYD